MLMNKKILLIKIAIFCLMLGSVAVSAHQLRETLSRCLGHPCMTNVDCGGECYCSNGMCFNIQK